MLRGRAKWLVLQCHRASGGRDSVDIDRACPFRVLENLPNQRVGPECRPSLAGVTSCDTVICRRVLSCTLSSAANYRAGSQERRVGATSLSQFWRWLWLARCALEFAKTLLLTWNTLGLIDIIFVVLSALRFGLNDWQSMHALREFPLSLLPTFLVPAYYHVTRLDLRPADPSAN